MRPEKTVKLANKGRERRLNGRIRMLVCTKNAVIEGIKSNRFFEFCA